MCGKKEQALLSKQDTAVAKSSVFFGTLPEPVFGVLIENSRVLTIDAGRTLFHQGEPAEAVFTVLEGLLKLSVGARDGSEAVVDVFGAGSSVAEALAFSENHYPVSATALLDSRVLAISNRAVQTTMRSNPDVFGAILGATYAHLHKLVRQIAQLKSTSGLERVATFILASTSEGSKPEIVEIPYEKKVLASLLGMKPETLSRSFRRLKAHGISVDGRRVVLHDRRALQRLLHRE